MNWLVFRIHDEILAEYLRDFARGRLLDIGCGESTYKDLCAESVDVYYGFDHPATKHNPSFISFWADAKNIPIKSSSIDTILCTAVLEHVDDPGLVIAECTRILARGGHCIISAPFFWHIHEPPRDFYRFTRYGIEHLLEKNGLRIVKIKPLSGFWVTFCQEFLYYLRRFEKWVVLKALIRCVGWCIQSSAYWMNRYDHSEGFTWMYMAVAKKM